MSQSASPQILTGAGQGVIQDHFGVEWQIDENGVVLAGSTPDADQQPVVALTFTNGVLWRQTQSDLRWSCKTHPHDPWGPSTHVSPLPGPPSGTTEIVDMVNANHNTVLRAIAALQQDFDRWKTQPPSPSAILAAITSAQADADAKLIALSKIVVALQNDLTTTNTLLDEIVQAQAEAVGVSTSNQTAIVDTLKTISTAQTSNQVAVVALLKEVIADISGSASPLAAIQVLQNDFTNLTQTLNSIALGISEKLQQILLLDDPTANAAMIANIATILADVTQILAIVKAEEPPPPTQIGLDIAHATHKSQPVPTTEGP